jgi:hypothetical protein
MELSLSHPSLFLSWGSAQLVICYVSWIVLHCRLYNNILGSVLQALLEKTLDVIRIKIVILSNASMWLSLEGL